MQAKIGKSDEKEFNTQRNNMTSEKMIWNMQINISKMDDIEKDCKME